MGMRMPETCWTVFKRQAINLRDWCIWLVDLFEWYIFFLKTVRWVYKRGFLQLYLVGPYRSVTEDALFSPFRQNLVLECLKGFEFVLVYQSGTCWLKCQQYARIFVNMLNSKHRVKAACAWGWQPYHFHVPIVLKYGSLNLLEPSGSVQACNGIALPLITCDPISHI